jgi:SAM-dependent methyltransferase
MMAEHNMWETTYKNAGTNRLWPQDPTICEIDFDAWRANRVRTVLDAGCGDGKNVAHLIRQGFFTVAVDASLSALTKCRQYLEEQELMRDCVLVGPVLLDKLPFLEHSVDAAICIDVLGHVEEPLPILQELARVVRPGGCVYASLFHLADGCRNGPRMVPLSAPNQFWYRPSSAIDVLHYFRFYDEAEARKLFESTSFQLTSMTSRRWEEPPHPGYRDEWHEHESWFGLLQKSHD